MAEDRIDSLIDVPKVLQEFSTIDTALKSLIDTMALAAKGMVAAGQGKSSDNESLKEAIRLYNQQQQAAKEASAAIKLKADEERKALNAQGQLTDVQKQAILDQQKLTQAKKDYTAGLKTENASIWDSQKVYGTVRSEMRAVREELVRLIEAGKGIDNPRVAILSKRMDDLKDNLTKARNQAELMDSAGKFTALIKGVTAVSAAFEVARGASALFGNENENLQKIMLKVQAAIALTHGLETLSNATRKESIIWTELQNLGTQIKIFFTGKATAAEVANTVAVTENTAANVANTASSKSAVKTGTEMTAGMTKSAGVWGLLAAVIAAAGYGLGRWKLSTMDSYKENEKLTTKIKEQNEVLNKAVDSYAETEAQVQLYTNTLSDSASTDDEKKDALVKLDEKMGTNLSSWNDQNEAVATALLLAPKYVDTLKLQAQAEAAKDLYVEKTKEAFKSQNSLLGDNLSWWEKITTAVGSVSKSDLTSTIFSWEPSDQLKANLKEKALQNQTEATKEANDAADDYFSMYTNLNEKAVLSEKELLDIKTKAGAVSTDTKNSVIAEKDAYEELTAKLSELQKKQKAYFAEGNQLEGEKLGVTIRTTQAQIDTYDALFNALSEQPELMKSKVIDSQKALVPLLTDYSQQYTDYLEKQVEDEEKAAEEKLKIEQELQKAKEDLIKKSSESATELLKIAVETQYNDEMHALDVKYESDSESLKEKLDNNLITQAQYDIKKEQLDEKKDAEELKLKQKKAKDEKAIEIAKIFANTAIAIMKTYAELGAVGGLALMPFLIAQGAMEAAIVAAQPIPKYAKGRSGGKAELAITGDSGSELLYDPKTGKSTVTPDRPTLTYLTEGMEVIPHDKLMKAMYENPDISFAESVNNSMIIADVIKSENEKTRTSIINKRENYLSITEKGMRVMSKNGNSWVEYIDKKLRN
jgi:hypothetical protein